VYFGHRIEKTTLPPEEKENRILKKVDQQLQEYFQGTRREFDLPLDAKGSQFQRSIWRELSKIPFGETRSYSELADAIGNPQAVRAVGLANGANPISIVVPCHRVIGKNGKLVGFGGGLEIKTCLLRHEGKLL
jgi:methylated-DNA-[protein]-cysteine S-methyltransferase